MGHDQVTNQEKLECKLSGITFYVRANATRLDQYQMNARMAEKFEIQDGKVISVPPGLLHPVLIRTFVVGWDQPEPWSYDAFEAMPATPGEDVILGLGSFIYNHVTGIRKLDDVKKKD